MRVNGLKSFKHEAHHWNDNFTNLGYHYETEGILKNVLSHELFSNPVQDTPLRQVERLVVYVVNTIKQIRTQYSIAHEKDTILIN